MELTWDGDALRWSRRAVDSSALTTQHERNLASQQGQLTASALIAEISGFLLGVSMRVCVGSTSLDGFSQ